MFTLNRLEHNPILSPIQEHPWEAHSSFNGCPIMKDDKIHLVYRAMSEPDHLMQPHISTSVIGIAESTDGVGYENRRQFFGPSEDFDKYGCEDPRITKIDDTYYIFYTALSDYPFSADNIKVAVALSDDLDTIKEKHLVTPFNAKAMALFPERVNGKLAALVTINTDKWPADICYVEFDTPEDLWNEKKWKEWMIVSEQHKINLRRKDTEQVEMGTPPLKTDKGWLVIYSHIQDYATPNPVLELRQFYLIWKILEE